MDSICCLLSSTLLERERGGAVQLSYLRIFCKLRHFWPLGTSVFLLRKVVLTCHLLIRALESQIAFLPHSLQEKASFGKSHCGHVSHLQGRRWREWNVGHHCWVHPSCRQPRAPSPQRVMAAGNTLHTPTRKKFGGFSDNWKEQPLSNTLQH